MISDKKSELIKRIFHAFDARILLPFFFKKLEVINDVKLKEDHSILLLQNHFSFWDGFFGSFLSYRNFKKRFHVMVLEERMKMHGFLRWRGAYSVKKNSREIMDSLQYTSQLLQDPGNLVLLFPQGRLQSIFVEEITIEQGVLRLIDKLEADCQIIYCATVINYFESFRPTVSFNLLDLGSANVLDKDQIGKKINDFHSEVAKSSVRQ